MKEKNKLLKNIVKFKNSLLKIHQFNLQML